MADFKLVGAVAIKVRPDATGFRRSAEKKIKEELKGYHEEVKLKAKVELNTTEAKAASDKFEKEESGKTVNWKVKLDHDSVRDAARRFDALFEPTKKIKFDMNDQGSIDKARAKIDKMLAKAKVKITYSQDEQGYTQVLNKIAAIRRQKLEKTIKFKTDDDSLDKLEREVRAKIAALHGVDIPTESTVKIQYDENRASLEAMLADIDRELAKFKDQTFYISPDKPSLLAAREAVREAISELPVKFEYDKNRTGLEKAIAEIDAELDKLRAKLFIEATLDEASLLAAREKLAAELKDIHETVKLSYTHDRASLEKVLGEIDKALSDLNNKVEIEVGLNEFELAWVRADIQAALANIPTTITYNKNRAGIEKAIAEINAELDKINPAKIDVKLNNADLIFARARLEEELANLKVKFEYDDNLAGLQAVRAKIAAQMTGNKLHIETTLDDAALKEQLAALDVRIRAAERNKIKIDTFLNPASYFKAFTAIKLLTKNQTVTIFTRLSNLGLLLAAAKLTGLRAATKWTQEFGRAIGTLDRNLPIVAAVVVALSTLSSGFITLAADAFSLGNGLGQVARMATLLAPAMILGLGSVMVVMKGVFKDFGAAVNGDTKALKALTPAGKEAAAGIRTVFQNMRETVSKNFWDKASDSMLRFTKTALPSFSAGLGGLATSLGGVFSHLLDSFSKFSEQSGLKTFFTNLNHGFDVAQNGLGDFMNGFLTLASVGSTVFPRIGRAFDEVAARFDAWVQRIAADGTLSRWIDIGIQGMKDLGSIAGGLVKVWGNIGTAAQAAGVMTLHSLSQALDRLDAVTSGSRFQQNMKTIFQGAREASQSFHKSLGDLGPAMDVFSVTIKNTLVGAAGALGSFIRIIGDVISSPKVNQGMTAFLTGIKSMFESLRPAAGDIANILMTFGQILGQVATDSGPLFLNLFRQLDVVLTSAWTALQPFLPGLIQLGTTVVDTLGPALGMVAREIIPTFAQGLQDVGNALLPVIQFLADFAAGASIVIASLPLPVLVGIATGILGVSAAIGATRVVLPLAAAALEVFGNAAAISGAKMQLLIPGIGIVLAAAAAIGAGALTAFATTQQSATPYANEYADALQRDADAAGGFAGAIGEATTALALKKLVDEGAYDAAQKLGIGQQEVTDAVLKGGPALDDLMNKVNAAKGNYQDVTNEALLYAASGQEVNAANQGMSDSTREHNDAAEVLGKVINANRGSLLKGVNTTKLLAEVNKQAGIETVGNAQAQKTLLDQALETADGLGAAAAATTTLTDTFSSSSAKIDAMRKTFELLVPTDSTQKVAESLGAYVKGLNDIRDTAIPLADTMRGLGDAVYGDGGFLNVATGNKAVLQINQSLVDEVNNVWLGAKTAYDAALAQGKNVVQAFNDAQQFVKDHKGDYDQLATDSGLAADKVQGQWEKVFGHEWVLKVSLIGATEAAAKAQAMMTAIGNKFDGKRFMAFLDANPDAALLAVTDASAAAKLFVNNEWKAKIDATPKPAQDAITELLNKTNKTWVQGDFESILKVAKDVPGLSEAILKIMNGSNNADYKAIIYAAANGVSLDQARRALDALTARRTAYIDVVVNQLNTPSFVPRGGQRVPTSANGSIMNGRGQGLHGFNPAVKYFANGGIERHVAQITKPGSPIRVWSEPETHGEAYLPYNKAKRPRSVRILKQVARDFGYTVSKADQYANGGITAGGSTSTSHTSADVHIGSIHTVDMHEAVAKLRQSQRDALAVAGISSIGV